MLLPYQLKFWSTDSDDMFPVRPITSHFFCTGKDLRSPRVVEERKTHLSSDSRDWTPSELGAPGPIQSSYCLQYINGFLVIGELVLPINLLDVLRTLSTRYKPDNERREFYSMSRPDGTGRFSGWTCACDRRTKITKHWPGGWWGVS